MCNVISNLVYKVLDLTIIVTIMVYCSKYSPYFPSHLMQSLHAQTGSKSYNK